jgi:hypothetical protein
MKPTFAELFFASRYMLPLWVVGSGWLWFSGHGDFIWSRLNEDDRVLAILFLSAIAAGMLKAFPKVWAHEQARRDYAAAGRDPEAVKRRRWLMLRLLAIAGWGGSLWWLTENSYAANPDLYRAALVIAAGGSLWALVAVYSRLPASLQNRLRRSGSGEQESFIVRWSLPVVKHAPNRKQIHTGLPDYCKLVLTT